MLSPSGGIGRRRGLKPPGSSQGHVGSSPTSGTKKIKRINKFQVSLNQGELCLIV